MSVSEELDLDITPALSAIGELETEFASAITTINNDVVELSSVIADSITAGAQQGSEALEQAITDASGTSIEITADTSQAEEQIEELGEVAASQDTEITVGADTQQAQDSLEGLSDVLGETGGKSDEAQSALTTLGPSVGALGGYAQTATGATSGLAGSIGGVVSKAGPYGAAAAVVVAGTIGMATAGAEVIAVNQRMETTFGDLASTFDTINVGSLNQELETLTARLGSDDEAVLEVVASMGQLAQASGFSTEASAEFSETVVALAARAVALNPALGDVATVAQNLGPALGRGGRFAAKLGIDLNAAEIKARAAENATRGLGDGVSQASLQMAGAELAAEKYGASLETDISKGSENAAFAVSSVSAQLANAFEPLQVALAEALLPTLKLLEPAIKGVSFVIQGMAAQIELVTDVTEAAVGWFQDATEATQEWADGVGGVVGWLGDAANAVSDFFGVTTDQPPITLGLQVPIEEMTQFGLSVIGVTSDVQIASGSLEEFGAVTEITTADALSALRKLADDGGESIQDFIDANTSSIEDLRAFNAARQLAIAEGNQALLDELNRLGPLASEALVASTNAAGEAEREALNNSIIQTQQVFQETADNRRAFLVNGSLTTGAEVGTAFALSLNGTVTALAPTNLSTVAAVAEAIKNGATPVFDQTGKVLGAVAADGTKYGIEQGRPTVQNAAGQMIAVAGPLLPTATSQGQQLGGAIGDGITSGLVAKAGSVVLAAQQTVDKMFAAANARAQTGSPSKLFAGLGRDIGDGLALGIDQSESTVVSAAESIIASAANTLDSKPLGEIALNTGNNSTNLTSLTVQVQVANAVGSDIEARRAGELIGNNVADVLRRNDLITSIRAGGRN